MWCDRAHQFITHHCWFPAPTITNDGISLIMNGTAACDLLGTYRCVAKNEVGTTVLIHRVLPFGKLKLHTIHYNAASC